MQKQIDDELFLKIARLNLQCIVQIARCFTTVYFIWRWIARYPSCLLNVLLFISPVVPYYLGNWPLKSQACRLVQVTLWQSGFASGS